MYSELPADLRIQRKTLGPPPKWFLPLGPYFFREFYGLGETPMQMTPIQILRNLKYDQEMPKKIPSVARKYTKIDPLSPMFRTNLPKYGFGDISITTSIAGIIAALGLAYLIFLKK